MLDEALATGRFRVSEVSASGTVPELKVSNGLSQPVLMLDGEELVGAKQNRILNLTVMVPAETEMTIPVSCVEAGRWRHTSDSFGSSNGTQFARGRARKLAQVSRSMRASESRRSDQSGAGYAGGQGNQLITNLKKSPLRRGRPEYRYKGRAIQECSEWLGGAVSDDWLRAGTLVPVPPSKARDHPEYDDRMVQVLNGIRKPFPVDVRELVVQTGTIRTAHENPHDRPTVDELVAIYEIDEARADPEPKGIAIVDDVLTAGVHYRAMHCVLSRRFPRAPIVGLFIARRVPSSRSAGTPRSCP